MLFSIIVPVYNVELYLNKCLTSILNQQYNDFEIILVDDGSIDNSGIICDEFAKKNKDKCKCKVIHKINQGLISARRVGLKEAKGDYIIFVDSDDMIRPDMLKQLATTIKETSSDVIIYQWQNMDMNGNLLNYHSYLELPKGNINKEKIIETVLSSSSLNSLCLKTCKRVLFDIDIDYSEFYYIQNAEDLLQSIPIFENAKTFTYIPESFYYYRANPTSLTHKIGKNQYKNLDVVRPMLHKMIKRLNLNNQENQLTFFNTYLDCVFTTVVQVCSSNDKTNNYILEEISSYPKVREAKKYLKDSKLGFKSKIILWLFYKKFYRLLHTLIKLK